MISRFNRFDWLILGIVFLIGIVNLPHPFGGDQALFTIGAKEMSHGGILYRHFWDVKQPGIFGFYLIGGMLFGFHEVGIHTFELLYMLGFSMVLMLTLKGSYKNSSLASLAPILTVGLYYAVSRAKHLTQVEVLVGFPLFLSLWYASESSQSGDSRQLRFFLSGIMGGIVLLFKLVFLPILTAFWFTALLDAIVRRREHPLNALLRIGGSAVLGLSVPLLIVFAYFLWHDTLDLLYWTNFKYPIRSMAEVGGVEIKIPRLVGELRWFIHGFSPLFSLGFIGAYTSLARRKDLMTMNLVIWCVLGFCIILIQYQSWWSYHYLLLSVPLAILSMKGLEFIWQHLEQYRPSFVSLKSRIILMLSLALLFSPALSSLALKSSYLAAYGFALKSEQRLKYKGRMSRDYNVILSDAAFLSKPESYTGDIYVFGNPIYYLISGRDQVIPLCGWSVENIIREQWVQLTENLAETLPPYIFVTSAYIDLIPNRSLETARFLEKNYRVLRRSEAGIWYVIKMTSGTVPNENSKSHLLRNTICRK